MVNEPRKTEDYLEALAVLYGCSKHNMSNAKGTVPNSCK